MRFLFILLLLILGCDDSDNPITQDNNFFVTMYNDNTNTVMMKFSEPLELTQFEKEYWLDDVLIECGDTTPISSCPTQADTTNIYKIANPSIFGVECHLIYDSNYYTLTGYNVTIEQFPEGTGDGCSPLYLDNIKSESGESLSEDITLIPSEEYGYIKTVPNPYYGHSLYNESPNQYRLCFTHLPATCTIMIYNGNRDIISSLYKEYSFNSNYYYGLTDSDGNIIDSGIYFYKIIIFDTPEGEIQVLDEIIQQGSLIVLKPIF